MAEEEDVGNQEQPVVREKIRDRSSDFRVRDLSCVTAFDKLFACFGPAHQMTLYYREGEIDSCAKLVEVCVAPTATSSFSDPLVWAFVGL